MSAELLRIEHLKKEYQGVTPLQDVNLSVHEGDVVAIIGPSGTGKSTLLRQINQMESATSGKIFFRGEEVTAPGYPMYNVWMIRHLPNDPWKKTRIVDERFAWLDED